MLLALTTLFVGFGTLSQNPTSGGYQLFERVASGISADIQLASLGNFAPSPETASEYANAPNNLPAATQPIVGDHKLQNLMDNIDKGTSNPNRVGDGTLADAVRYENATGGTVGGRTHTIKAQETIRGLQNWLDRNPHGLQADRQEAITQIQNLQDALGS